MQFTGLCCYLHSNSNFYYGAVSISQEKYASLFFVNKNAIYRAFLLEDCGGYSSSGGFSATSRSLVERSKVGTQSGWFTSYNLAGLPV